MLYSKKKVASVWQATAIIVCSFLTKSCSPRTAAGTHDHCSEATYSPQGSSSCFLMPETKKVKASGDFSALQTGGKKKSKLSPIY